MNQTKDKLKQYHQIHQILTKNHTLYIATNQHLKILADMTRFPKSRVEIIRELESASKEYQDMMHEEDGA